MARGGADFPLVFDQGFGVTVKDPDGNLYIDLSAGVGGNSVGRCHPQVVEAIALQAKRLMHGSDIGNSRRAELAERISQVMPEGLRARLEFSAKSPLKRTTEQDIEASGNTWSASRRTSRAAATRITSDRDAKVQGRAARASRSWPE
ncbi:MAG: aminotransferase class III-fold pyridoxal phosphate-dependent enzyme [Steroidobacteraceae bacterium]